MSTTTIEPSQQPQASFGTDLWDNMQAIETYTQEGLDQLVKAQEFFKRRSALDLQYSKDLQKLSDQFKEKDKKKKKSDGTTLSKSFDNILDQTESLARIHSNISQFMDVEIGTSLKNSLKTFEAERKMRLAEVVKTKSDLKKYYDQLDKSKKAYEHACKIAEDARIVAEKAKSDMNVTKAYEDKVKDDAGVKSKKAEEADEEYQRLLSEANAKQNKHYQEDLPGAINLVQKMEENRFDHLKGIFMKFGQVGLQQVPELTMVWTKIVENASALDKKQDSLTFINANKNGSPYPPPIPYENYWEKYALKTQKKLLALQGATDDEKLEGMAPEKAIKKATQRLKEIDKDIFDLENKKAGIEVLADAYESNPQFADSKALMDISNQLGDLEQKIDILRLKKFKYDSFLAKQESKPAPKMPGLYADAIQGPAAAQLRALVLGEKAIPFNMSSLSIGADDKKPDKKSSDELNAAEFNSKEALKYVVLYDFEGNGSSNELPVQKGEFVKVIDKPSEKGWCKAQNSQGRVGFVPSTYIELCLYVFTLPMTIITFRTGLYTFTALTGTYLAYTYYYKSFGHYPSDIRRPLKYALTIKNKKIKINDDLYNQEQAFKEAIRNYEQNGLETKSKAYTGILYELAEYYRAINRPKEAVEFYQSALQTFNHENDSSPETIKYRVNIAHNLANVYSEDLKENEKAVSWLDWSVNLMIVSNNSPEYAAKNYGVQLMACLDDLGSIYIDEKKFMDALLVYSGMVKIFGTDKNDKINCCRAAYAHNAIADLHFRKNDKPEFRKHIRIANETVTDALYYSWLWRWFNQETFRFCKECQEAIIDNAQVGK